jgi:hypothetical protein
MADLPPTPGSGSQPGLYQHYWRWKSKLPERYGEPCWVTARGAKNTVRVDFLDGFFVFTSRFAVRRIRIA